MHKPESVLENETHKILRDFEIKTDHLIPARRPELVLIGKKKTCLLVDFAVPADHRVKIKESEKINKYIDLARELRKLWNMKVVPIVIGVLGTVPKSLEKNLGELEVRGRIETIQSTALLGSARILRRVRET